MIKLLGGAMILGASVWTGMHGAWRLRQMDGQLRELAAALDRMECEVSYTSTRFHPLCKRISDGSRGETAAFFRELAQAPLTGPGMTKQAVVSSGLLLPETSYRALERLLDGFGHYDLESQVRLIRQAAEEIRQESERIRGQLAGRCRTYEMLGLCTGAAVLILVI